MKKSILAITVSMIISLIGVTATAAEFTDTEGHWAEETIEKWADKGLVSGYSDGTFLPDNPVTRAELAKIMTVAFDLDNTNENKLLESPYSDVDESEWYWEYIKCADAYIPTYALAETYETNIPYIENDDGFLPNTPTLRVHAAEALASVMIEQNDIDITLPEITEIQADLLETFNDASYENLLAGMHGIPTNVRRMFEYTWLANELGIMQGDENGYFNPYGQITRAELVTMVDRIIGE